ncbi:hypothetical protein TOPH_08602 [Tolypocladium ophioglossoides CBS 100239]|uniref:Uncharacterized protein n=1 Tax=Tolypocladium ophioglossoides (strain CBS 100239) TaxID=1163406 RepID=A0A0L0MY79_TOLOC|nr:hypothetical protein TOPH_08602 [Tolypocladium ophioglossoides CBS 100239]
MGNKRRVVVTVHHRDELSLGNNRDRLGYEAFHWGILCNAYDVSDGATIDPDTWQDLNPSREWYFRPKHGVDPVRSGRLLGRIIIGKVPKNITDADIKALLADVPLPAQNATPQQSCVT